MAHIGQVQVNLFCDDVARCLAFYTRLGLTEAFRAPSDGLVEHVEVEAAGIRLGLTSARVANELVDLGVQPGHPVAAEVAFWCDDTDALYAAALDAGATSVVGPMDSPDGRLHYAWVRDPEGHQVKFVQQR
jgi:catechol 2,3-dioxygenase-like lactoylglutathione lyase family enzyme